MFDDLPMKKKFSSYIGVVLGIFNSGGSENNLGVTPRANTILRPDIIERAWRSEKIQKFKSLYYSTTQELIRPHKSTGVINSNVDCHIL